MDRAGNYNGHASLLPVYVPVKEKSPKSSNEDGKYRTALFSPGWTGNVTHQTTEMSSAEFAAGHFFV